MLSEDTRQLLVARAKAVGCPTLAKAVDEILRVHLRFDYTADGELLLPGDVVWLPVLSGGRWKLVMASYDGPYRHHHRNQHRFLVQGEATTRDTLKYVYAARGKLLEVLQQEGSLSAEQVDAAMQPGVVEIDREVFARET